MIERIARRYRIEDRAACLALFDANCPRFFAPSERDAYATFLDALDCDYFVRANSQQITFAFGLGREAERRWRIRWILLDPTVHRRGLGSTLMRLAIRRIRSGGGGQLLIAASHLSSGFFSRFGAETELVTPDGWGPGLHRVDMCLTVSTTMKTSHAAVTRGGF